MWSVVMDCDEDVYVDILDENPDFSVAGGGQYGGKEIAESGEFDRWNVGREVSDAAVDDGYERYSTWSNYEYLDYGCSGSGQSKLKSVIVGNPYEGDSEHSEKVFGDNEHSSSKLPRVISACDNEHASEKLECGDKESRRSSKLVNVISDYDREHVPKYFKHEWGEKERTRNYRRRQEVETDDDDGDLEWFSKKHSKHESSFKHKIVVDDNKLDDDLELLTNSSKYCEESHLHEKLEEKKSSFLHAKFGPEEKLENDHRGKEKLKRRHGGEKREWTRNHDQDGEQSLEREGMERSYDKLKERGKDEEDEKLKIPPKRKSCSTKYQSEHDDYWETERSQERRLMKRQNDLWEWVRDSSRERELPEREKEGELRGGNFRKSRDRELIETEKETYLRERDEAYWEESQTTEKDRESKKLSGIRDLMGRNLSILNRESKGESYRGVPAEVENGTVSKEQDRESLVSRKLFETRKEREARLKDADIFEKSHQTKGYKESWEKAGKKVDVRKQDREMREKSWGRVEMRPANKIYSREQDRKYREESYENEWQKDTIGRSWKLGFGGTDSRKQFPKERYHAVKGIESRGRDRQIRAGSHEREWDKETRKISRKGHLFHRDLRIQESENQGIHTVQGLHVRERDSESREESQESEWDREKKERYRKRDFRERDSESREESQESEWDREKKERYRKRDFRDSDVQIRNREVREKIGERENEEGHQVREWNNEKTETSRRRHLVERNTSKHDIELRDKSREREVVHSVQELRDRIWDLESLENNLEAEVLKRGKEMRRDHDKMLREKIQEDESVDRENEIDSNLRDDSGSREKSLERAHVEKRKVRELWEEEDQCRKECNDKKDKETEACGGSETERRQNTVLAYQISSKADDRDVYNFFAKVGRVRDVQLVMDAYSRHFTGVGYIEFYHATSIPIATSLSGQLLHGLPVIVKPLEADTSLMQSTTNAAVGDNVVGAFSGGSKRLCVGNLRQNVTEDILWKVFEIFGTVERVQLPSTKAAECEQNGFIEFATLEDARAAQSLNGHLSLAGQLIKVSFVTDQDEFQGTGADSSDINKDEGSGLVPAIQDQDGVEGPCANTLVFNVSEGADQSSTGESGSTLQKLDPVGNETNNGIITSSSALNLDSVDLLSESTTTKKRQSIKAFAASLKAVCQVPGASIPIIDTIGIPSECLLLKNVFDPNLQTEEDFDWRIKEEVEFKCYKFGKLKEVHVDKNIGGFVYLRFEDTQTAIIAQRSLHGRWFDGKMLTATYMAPQDFDAKFPTNEQAYAQGPTPAKWLLQNCETRCPSSRQAMAHGPTPAAWVPQNYKANFYSQQPFAQGPPPTTWLPNANPAAPGAGFINGAQFMQPMMPHGTFYWI